MDGSREKGSKIKQKQYLYYVYGGNYPQRIEDAMKKRGVWTKLDKQMLTAKSKERQQIDDQYMQMGLDEIEKHI